MGKTLKGCLAVIGGLIAVLFLALIFAPEREPTVCDKAGGLPHHRLIALSERNLKYPDTFERHAPPGGRSYGRTATEDGRYRVWITFTAKNAFGVPSRHVSSVWVSEKDCTFDFKTFRMGEAR